MRELIVFLTANPGGRFFVGGFCRRYETCFPIEDHRLRQKVIDEALKPYLRDNCQSWELGSDGEYTRLKRGKDARFCAQDWLLERLCD